MTLDLDKYLDTKVHLRYRKALYSLLDLKHHWYMQKWMRILFPTATVEDHFDLRDQALEEAEKLEEEWDRKLREQFEKTFGRKKKDEPYYWGSGYDEFPKEVQTELQGIASLTEAFRQIALLHDLMLPLKERNSREFFVNRLPKKLRGFIVRKQIERLRKKSKEELADAERKKTNTNL